MKKEENFFTAVSIICLIGSVPLAFMTHSVLMFLGAVIAGVISAVIAGIAEAKR